MRALAHLEGSRLGEAAGLSVDAGETRSGERQGLGWIGVFAAALFLTAMLGLAQVAGPQATSVDDEVLANLEHVVE